MKLILTLDAFALEVALRGSAEAKHVAPLEAEVVPLSRLLRRLGISQAQLSAVFAQRHDLPTQWVEWRPGSDLRIQQPAKLTGPANDGKKLWLNAEAAAALGPAFRAEPKSSKPFAATWVAIEQPDYPAGLAVGKLYVRSELNAHKYCRPTTVYSADDEKAPKDGWTLAGQLNPVIAELDIERSGFIGIIMVDDEAVSGLSEELAKLIRRSTVLDVELHGDGIFAARAALHQRLVNRVFQQGAAGLLAGLYAKSDWPSKGTPALLLDLLGGIFELEGFGAPDNARWYWHSTARGPLTEAVAAWCRDHGMEVHDSNDKSLEPLLPATSVNAALGPKTPASPARASLLRRLHLACDGRNDLAEDLSWFDDLTKTHPAVNSLFGELIAKVGRDPAAERTFWQRVFDIGLGPRSPLLVRLPPPPMGISSITRDRWEKSRNHVGLDLARSAPLGQRLLLVALHGPWRDAVAARFDNNALPWRSPWPMDNRVWVRHLLFAALYEDRTFVIPWDGNGQLGAFRLGISRLGSLPQSPSTDYGTREDLALR
jgi:hypothetical protein